MLCEVFQILFCVDFIELLHSKFGVIYYSLGMNTKILNFEHPEH